MTCGMLGPYVQSGPMASALKLSPTHSMETSQPSSYSSAAAAQNGYALSAAAGQSHYARDLFLRRDYEHAAAASAGHSMFSTGLHAASSDPFSGLHDPMQASIFDDFDSERCPLLGLIILQGMKGFFIKLAI